MYLSLLLRTPLGVNPVVADPKLWLVSWEHCFTQSKNTSHTHFWQLFGSVWKAVSHIVLHPSFHQLHLTGAISPFTIFDWLYRGSSLYACLASTKDLCIGSVDAKPVPSEGLQDMNGSHFPFVSAISSCVWVMFWGMGRLPWPPPLGCK